MSPMNEDDLKQQIESQLQVEDEMLRQYVAKQQRGEGQTSEEMQNSVQITDTRREQTKYNDGKCSMEELIQNIKD